MYSPADFCCWITWLLESIHEGSGTYSRQRRSARSTDGFAFALRVYAVVYPPADFVYLVTSALLLYLGSFGKLSEAARVAHNRIMIIVLRCASGRAHIHQLIVFTWLSRLIIRDDARTIQSTADFVFALRVRPHVGFAVGTTPRTKSVCCEHWGYLRANNLNDVERVLHDLQMMRMILKSFLMTLTWRRNAHTIQTNHQMMSNYLFTMPKFFSNDVHMIF